MNTKVKQIQKKQHKEILDQEIKKVKRILQEKQQELSVPRVHCNSLQIREEK